MGRGRAKAKQTKVARNLKYNSGPSMDLNRLQKDLHSDDPLATYEEPAADDAGAADDDPYAEYVDGDEEGSAAS